MNWSWASCASQQELTRSWHRSEKAWSDFTKALAKLDQHLDGKTYLVNDTISLADIAVVATLLYPFKLVVDGEFMRPFVNVVRWFQECLSKEEFKAVLGEVELFKGSSA